MLTDDHMFLFNEILELNQIGFIMQPTIFLQNLSSIKENQSNSKFVQILFSGSNDAGHWTAVYYDGSFLHVYDSLGWKLNMDHKIFLKRIFPDFEELIVIYEKVQKQQKKFNCGLFAIANIISIIFGICPCLVEYKESQMRNHYLDMIESKKLTTFPVEESKFNSCKFKAPNNNHDIVEHFEDLKLETIDMRFLTSKLEDVLILHVSNFYIQYNSNCLHKNIYKEVFFYFNRAK